MWNGTRGVMAGPHPALQCKYTTNPLWCLLCCPLLRYSFHLYNVHDPHVGPGDHRLRLG